MAFMVAAISYWRSTQIRREEQARLVYSKHIAQNFHEPGTEFEMLASGARIGKAVGGIELMQSTSPNETARYRALVPVIQLTAAIHNGSKELIGPAKIQVVNTGRKKLYSSFSLVVDAVDPESDHTVEFVWPNVDHPGQPGLGTTLIFRDASGRWWRRHVAQPIEAVHDDPENDAYAPTERANAAARARAMGVEPSPEPKVSLRVRWHRFWRKRRGRSPIP
ncbi:hypothetical protein [Micromonospora aurantiaca (nom. illeg.)]|uniref:hypothetical protein n=1 Tax=Micromonospora aurantiaca (nom. illeg.) TaxID=47850 RepID=UPI0038123BF7